MTDGEVAVALAVLYLEGKVEFSEDGEEVWLTEKGEKAAADA